MNKLIKHFRFLLVGLLICLTGVAQTSKFTGNKNDYPVFKMQEFHERGGLPNVFHKIATQRQVRIGYIGGSITAAKDGWRDLTFNWFRLTFPQTAFYQIDAAINGTGSNLGVFRMEHDVLSDKPDLIFVEFVVNDNGETRENILRSMEGLIRKTWSAFPNTDICLVYTTHERHCYNLVKGKLPQASEVMEELAEYYKIPSINVGMEIARLYAKGKLILRGEPSENEHTIVFSKDGTHPLSESGHPLYANIVVKYLDKMSKKAYKKEHQLLAFYIADNWQAAQMIDISRTELLGKWTKLSEDNPIMQQFSKFMPIIFQAKPGSSMRFKFRGSVLGFYDCIGPGTGTIEVSVDGKEQEIYRFDKVCDEYREARFFIEGLKDGIHEVEVQVPGVKIDKAAILSENGTIINDSTLYAGFDWYPAKVMIVGELLK